MATLQDAIDDGRVEGLVVGEAGAAEAEEEREAEAEEDEGGEPPVKPGHGGADHR